MKETPLHGQTQRDEGSADCARSAAEREFDEAYERLAQRKAHLEALFELVDRFDPNFSRLDEELDSCYDLLNRL